MATKKQQSRTVASQSAVTSNTEKDPSHWTTGGEPMTGAQRSYLHTLSDEAGVDDSENLSKAEASQKIDALRRDGHTVASRATDLADGSNTEKDPREWTTGSEPMTGAQRSYLKTLSEEAGEPFDDQLTKANASMKIDALRSNNPRAKAGE